MEWVGSTSGLQPEIVPSSPAKMKRLGPEAAPLVMTKSVVPLKTSPVGLPPSVLVGAGGTVTTSGEPFGKGRPFASYSVEVPVPLLATQNGEVGPSASP